MFATLLGLRHVAYANMSSSPLHYKCIYKIKKELPVVGVQLGGLAQVCSLSSGHGHVKVWEGTGEGAGLECD